MLLDPAIAPLLSVDFAAGSPGGSRGSRLSRARARGCEGTGRGSPLPQLPAARQRPGRRVEPVCQSVAQALKPQQSAKLPTAVLAALDTSNFVGSVQALNNPFVFLWWNIAVDTTGKRTLRVENTLPMAFYGELKDQSGKTVTTDLLIGRDVWSSTPATFEFDLPAQASTYTLTYSVKPLQAQAVNCLYLVSDLLDAVVEAQGSMSDKIIVGLAKEGGPLTNLVGQKSFKQLMADAYQKDAAVVTEDAIAVARDPAFLALLKGMGENVVASVLENQAKNSFLGPLATVYGWYEGLRLTMETWTRGQALQNEFMFEAAGPQKWTVDVRDLSIPGSAANPGAVVKNPNTWTKLSPLAHPPPATQHRWSTTRRPTKRSFSGARGRAMRAMATSTTPGPATLRATPGPN